MKQNKIPRNEYIIKPKGKTNPYKDDVVYSNLGQWKYPGQVTKIPSNQITMQGVNYPVQGIDDTGYSQMMYPGMDYTFPGEYVTEYPMQFPFGGIHTKTDTHMATGGWLDSYDEGGNNPITAPAATSAAASEKALKEEKNYDTLFNYLQEKKRVESVRNKAAEIAANKAKSANPSTRTNLSYIKNGAYYCNTHTGECFQDAGATTPTGKKVPVIPGNLQWDSEMKKLGFDWTDTPEPGDIAREQLYRTMDYQGNPLSPGWYTSHSGVVTKGGDNVMIGNAPGGARDKYVNQPVNKMTGGRDAKTVHMKYQRYVGNLPGMQQDYDTIMRNLNSEPMSSTTPSYDITTPLEERDIIPQSELRYGGWLDDEEFRRGGQKGLKNFTSKNVYTSINDIMLRNEKVFGPAGKRRYKPGLSYQEGGGFSIVDYLTSKGQDSSKEYRQQLAQKYGVANYDFSAEKNLELLDKLKNSKPVAVVKQPVAKAPAQSYFIKPIKDNRAASESTGVNKNTAVKTPTTLKNEDYYAQNPTLKRIKEFAASVAKNADPNAQPAFSQAAFVSDADKATSDKIKRRLEGRKAYENTIVGDLDLQYLFDPKYMDLGVIAGDVASLPSRFKKMSNEEIASTTNNPLKATGLSSEIATQALANELIGYGAGKVLNKTVVPAYEFAKKEIPNALAKAPEILNKGVDKLLDTPIGTKLVNKLGEKKLRTIMPEAFAPIEQLTEEGAKKVMNINTFANKYEAVTKDAYINGLRQKGYTPKEAKELARREAAKFLGEYDLASLHPDIIENVTGMTLPEIAAEYEALATAKAITPTSKATNFVPKADAPLNLNTIKNQVSEIPKLKSKKQFLEADPSGMYSENLTTLQKLYRDKVLKRVVKNKFGMPMSSADEFLLAEENQMIPIIESSSRSNPMADLFQAAQRGKTAPKGTPYMSGSSLSDNSFPISLAMTKKALINNEVNPMFMGYGPLNKMGHLSKYGNDPKLTLDYINSEIAKFNKGIPKNIQIPNAFLKGDDVFYPRIGLKNKKYGGNWLDNMY